MEVPMNNPFSERDEYIAQFPMTVDRVASVRARAERAFPEAVRVRYARMLQDWAGTNDGLIPTFREAQLCVQSEFEVVCRGLGRLATVDPRQVFDFQAPQSQVDPW